MALEYKELADRLDRQQPSWAGGSPHGLLSAGSELNDPARHE
jgi:hypothetical protein